MNIKELSMIELVHILNQTTEQGVINIIAYELVCRIYSPETSEKTFEEILESFGYKKLKENSKTLKLK